MNVHQILEKPEWMTASRSASRKALAEHIARIDEVERGALEHMPAIDHARAALRNAEAQVKAAEAEIAAINLLELAELVQSARSGAPTNPKTQRALAIATTRADEFKRQASLALEVLAQVTAPFDELRQASLELQGQLGPLTAMVMAELHAAALARMDRARRELVEAELDARGITMALSDEGRRLQDMGADGMQYFRVGNPLSQSFLEAAKYESPAPADIYSATWLWSEFLGRLARDPDAKPPEQRR